MNWMKTPEITSAPPLIPAAVSSPAQLPLVEELSPAVTSIEVFRRLAHLPHCVFFDSAQSHDHLGR